MLEFLSAPQSIIFVGGLPADIEWCHGTAVERMEFLKMEVDKSLARMHQKFCFSKSPQKDARTNTRKCFYKAARWINFPRNLQFPIRARTGSKSGAIGSNQGVGYSPNLPSKHDPEPPSA